MEDGKDILRYAFIEKLTNIIVKDFDKKYEEVFKEFDKKQEGRQILKINDKPFSYDNKELRFNNAYLRLVEQAFGKGIKKPIEAKDVEEYLKEFHKKAYIRKYLNKIMNKEDYNKESVEYCLNCGSLHIVEEESLSVCNNCGSIDFTGFASINEWLKIRGDQKMD